MKLDWTKIDRRKFLKGVTALGAMAALPSAMPGRAFAADDGTLRYRNHADMQSMDPAFSKGLLDEDIHANVYNKLIQFKPGSEWGYQLDAAAMIEQVDDTHIKFALRDDIGFTNGFGAMTAEDVKFSFERIADPEVDVILTTGGTGFTGRDVTPDALEPLFDKRMDGFSIAFHMLSHGKIGSSTVQSRATAGLMGTTFVFCLPGSPGACKDAWDGILKDQLDYRHQPCNFVEIMPRLDEHLRRGAG